MHAHTHARSAWILWKNSVSSPRKTKTSTQIHRNEWICSVTYGGNKQTYWATFTQQTLKEGLLRTRPGLGPWCKDSPELVTASKDRGSQGCCIGPRSISFNPHPNSRWGLNPTAMQSHKPPTQKGPTLGFMLCSCHLEILYNFEQGALPLNFALDLQIM